MTSYRHDDDDVDAAADVDVVAELADDDDDDDDDGDDDREGGGGRGGIVVTPSTILGVAAVTRFADLADVAARSGGAPEAVAEVLLPVIEVEADATGAPRWTLRADVRRSVLAGAGAARVAAWTRAIATPPVDAVDGVLRAWLGGELALERRVGDAREAVRRVASWLRDCTWLRPTCAEASREVDLQALRDQLASAASAAFVGRVGERRWLTAELARRPHIAVIEAKGGMGKSALLARWLIHRGAFRDPGAIAIMLDFDDPTLSPLEPDAIFAEIGRQAALQVPALAAIASDLRDQAGRAQEDAGEAVKFTHRPGDDARTSSLVFALFEALGRERLPVVIVLDTLERALRGPVELVDQLVTQLRVIASSHTIALIIAGRGPIELPSLAGAPRRALGPLNRKDATKLLASRGVALAQALDILERVPASPLTLRLAARAVGRLGAGALDGDDLQRAIESAEIDGYLHARVLAHLPSARLARVGQTALLLRELTAERLLEIVGPLVEPPITTAREAGALFDQLTTVSDLVATTAYGRLALRPELFDEVTHLLHTEDPGQAARLHARAVEVLGAAADPERDYHARALAGLGRDRGQPVPHSAGAAALTLSQLHLQLPALLRAGRMVELAATVEREPGAQHDCKAQLYGARAALALGDLDLGDSFVQRATATAATPVHHAQASLLAAALADRRDDALTARAARQAVRDELANLASGGATPLERAELIVGVAIDDRAWAAGELAASFARREFRDELATAELDLIRGVCAIACTQASLTWAADIKAFEHTEHVDCNRLADLVLSDGELLVNLQLGREYAEVVDGLRRLQRERTFSSAMSYILHAHGADPVVREVAADVLQQMRVATATTARTYLSATPAGALDRGRQIADLARTIATTAPPDLDVPGLFERAGVRIESTDRARASHPETLIHKKLLDVDRGELGEALARELGRLGLSAAAHAAAALFGAAPAEETTR